MRKELSLRQTQISDKDMLYKWRNDPRVYQFFLNPEPVDYDKHVEWFENKLMTDDTLILIAELDGCSLGMIRFDFESDFAVVSITVDPSFWGKGYGKLILRKSINYIKDNFKQIVIVKAQIDAKNIASAKIFENNGFRFVRNVTGIKEYEKEI